MHLGGERENENECLYPNNTINSYETCHFFIAAPVSGKYYYDRFNYFPKGYFTERVAGTPRMTRQQFLLLAGLSKNPAMVCLPNAKGRQILL